MEKHLVKSRTAWASLVPLLVVLASKAGVTVDGQALLSDGTEFLTLIVSGLGALSLVFKNLDFPKLLDPKVVAAALPLLVFVGKQIGVELDESTLATGTDQAMALYQTVLLVLSKARPDPAGTRLVLLNRAG